MSLADMGGICVESPADAGFSHGLKFQYRATLNGPGIRCRELRRAEAPATLRAPQSLLQQVDST